MIAAGFDETVYGFIEKHPDIRDIVTEAGFSNITGPEMFDTAGRIMNIRK